MARSLFALFAILALVSCAKVPGFKAENFEYTMAQKTDLTPPDTTPEKGSEEDPTQTPKKKRGTIVRTSKRIEMKPTNSKWLEGNKKLILTADVKIDGKAIGQVEFEGTRNDSKILLNPTNPELKDNLKAQLYCTSEDETCNNYFIDVVYRDNDVLYVDQVLATPKEEPKKETKKETPNGNPKNPPSPVKKEDESYELIDMEQIKNSGFIGTSDEDLRLIFNIPEEEKPKKKKPKKDYPSEPQQQPDPKQQEDSGKGGQNPQQPPKPAPMPQPAPAPTPAPAPAPQPAPQPTPQQPPKPAPMPQPAPAPRPTPAPQPAPAPHPAPAPAPAPKTPPPSVKPPIGKDDGSGKGGQKEEESDDDDSNDINPALRALEKFKRKDQAVNWPFTNQGVSGRLDRGIDFRSVVSSIPGIGFQVVGPTIHSFGTYNLIRVVASLGQWLKEAIPNRFLRVTSIAMKNGGPSSLHSSHQNGNDIDILYMRNNENGASDIVVGGRVSTNFLVKDQWALTKKAFETGEVDVMFMDRTVKKALCEYAISTSDYKRGDDNSAVAEMFKHIQHVDGHENHFHIRVKCGADDVRCRKVPYKSLPLGC